MTKLKARNNSVCNTTPLLWIKLQMIIDRWVKNVSDDTPTGMGGVRLKNESNLIRGWNRVRRSSIKSNICTQSIHQLGHWPSTAEWQG